MSAADYPIDFPYEATSAPYSPSRPHRGNDRACPTGTPIIISGVTIGRTGATGDAYDSQGNKGTAAAAHLHTQEWNGSYGNTRKPQNEFKPGTVIGVYPNSAGDGSFGKFIDIQNADGWVTSYCHLSEINVKVGQVIGGNMAEKVALSAARIFAETILGRDRNKVHKGDHDADLKKNHVGKDLTNGYIQTLWTSTEAKNAAATRAKNAKEAARVPGLLKEIEELKKSQSGEFEKIEVYRKVK